MELTIDLLLANSCSNPAEPYENWKDKGLEEYKGFNKYEIELHCAKFIVIARPLEIELAEGEEWTPDKARYEIKSFTQE